MSTPSCFSCMPNHTVFTKQIKAINTHTHTKGNPKWHDIQLGLTLTIYINKIKQYSLYVCIAQNILITVSASLVLQIATFSPISLRL